MSAQTTVFRQALQTVLADAYGFEFVGGIIEPPMTRQIGCVWHTGKRPWARDGNEEEVLWNVRVFELFRQNQGETNEFLSIEALETSEELLQTTLRAVLVEIAGTDLFTITTTGINHEGEYVEATLIAYQRNLGARGG